MLCLKCDTDPEWISAASRNLNSILIDHAHCEKKAAATGMSLLSTYPEKFEISLQMANLVEEEIGHYRSVLELLKERNLSLPRDSGDPYVRSLLKYVRKDEPGRLLDRLLTAGIIEARSCERLQILADNINDARLKSFYTTLVSSEAGHYVTFVKLARIYFPDGEVKQRLEQLTDIEREIVVSLPNHPTMHG